MNVNVSIPDKIARYMFIDEDQTELERNAMLLYPYIKNLTISHGKAAEILGISKWDLIEIYNNVGLAYLDFDISEVEEEVELYNSKRGDKK